MPSLVVTVLIVVSPFAMFVSLWISFFAPAYIRALDATQMLRLTGMHAAVQKSIEVGRLGIVRKARHLALMDHASRADKRQRHFVNHTRHGGLVAK